MDALYKYMRSASARELLGDGRIRIGTLFEYRNTCRHPEEVADQKEGNRQIVVDVSNPDTDPREEVERVVRDHGLDEQEAADLRVESRDDAIIVEARSPNLYLFCASRRCDHELMCALGYDACVRISEPARFFDALTASINGVRSFLGFREVIYEDPHRPKSRDAGVHPAFFKHADYSHQDEVRALWEPEECRIEPVVIACRGAARFCDLCMSR